MRKYITNLFIVLTLLTGLSAAAVWGFTASPATTSTGHLTAGLQNRALQNSSVAETSNNKKRIIKKKKRPAAR